MVRPTIELRTVPLTGSESSLPIEDGEDADWVESPIGASPAPGGQWKQAARAATTADLDAASDLEDGDTLDGVTLVEGDRVLVKDQADAVENGIYIVSDTGPADRALDMDDESEIVGAVLRVIEGTAGAGTTWVVTNATPPAIGFDDITFEELATGGGATALDDLTDVNAPSPADQDVLTWDDGAGEWIAQAPAAGPTDVSIIWVTDGGGSAIAPGSKGFYKVAFGCEITDWELESDVSCSATMTVKKRAYGGGAASSIVAAAKPTLSAATENNVSAGSGSLSGWTTTIAAGDKLYFSIDTNDNAKQLTLTLVATRT